MVLFPPLLSHFWQTLSKEFLIFCNLCFQGVKLASQPKEQLPWVAIPHTFAQTFGLPFRSGSQNAWPVPRALASCLNPRNHSAFCLCWGTYLMQVVWLKEAELGWKPREKEDVTCDPWHHKGYQLWNSWVGDTQSQGSGRRAKASLCSGCEVIKTLR